jgi:hypothetical protein
MLDFPALHAFSNQRIRKVCLFYKKLTLCVKAIISNPLLSLPAYPVSLKEILFVLYSIRTQTIAKTLILIAANDF